MHFRFNHWIIIPAFLVAALQGLPAAQGDETNIYLPWVIKAEIVYPTTTLVSIASDGTKANDDSFEPSISADGRFVAFYSDASNLVSGDTNNSCGHLGSDNCRDVFVHDLSSGETTRVSVASDGTQGNNESWAPSISADGRFVAFTSAASNLVNDDNNDAYDIFVHELATGETTRISVAADGAEANGRSYYPSISADGRFVAFESGASNLVNGDTNEPCGEYDQNCPDIFVHDRQTGETTRVSVSSDGTQANGSSDSAVISATGRFVAFVSWADNLVSGDTYVCINSGSQNCPDIFVHDNLSGKTARVSVASDGSEANAESWDPSISADGTLVAFASEASNLVSGDSDLVTDVFVHDLQNGTTSRVPVEPNEPKLYVASFFPSISSDGRYVAFQSNARNVDSGIHDVYIHNRLTGVTTIVSVLVNEALSPYGSGSPSLSADGRYVAFTSVVNAEVGRLCWDWFCEDIFVRDRGTVSGP